MCRSRVKTYDNRSTGVVERKGLVQAIGIILGFSLGFLGNWALGEGVWEVIHLPALLTLVGGNAVLIVSLYRLTMPKYRREKIPGMKFGFSPSARS